MHLYIKNIIERRRRIQRIAYSPWIGEDPIGLTMPTLK